MSKESKDEKGYSGWKNYETWVTKLWLDNDENDYNHCRAITEGVKHLREQDVGQVKEGIWTIEEARKFMLADKIKAKVEKMIANEVHGANLATDLVNGAVSEIDFNEIAENMLSE